MRCERCGKEEGVVRLTRIDENGNAETHVLGQCDECREILGQNLPKSHQKKTTLDEVLKELLAAQSGQKVPKSESFGSQSKGEVKPVGEEIAPCTSCGYEFKSYKKTFLLGCPDCYESFAEHLEPYLEKYHGATRHVGDLDPGQEQNIEKQKTLRALKEELRDCLEYEDFDRAAFLRDEISKLEKQLREGVAPDAEEE